MFIPVGAFLVLRQKVVLGYALLLAGLLYIVAAAFILSSNYYGVTALFGAIFLVSLVAWFCSNYELNKKAKAKA